MVTGETDLKVLSRKMKKAGLRSMAHLPKGVLYLACLLVILVINIRLAGFETRATAQPGTTGSKPVAPVLLSPADGAILPQPGNGSWTFDWADSSNPDNGISGYQLYVIGAKATIPRIDVTVPDSFYTRTLGGYIIESNRYGWTWKVRVQNNVGEWSDWSPTRTFDVEPITSPPSVSLPPPASAPTVPILLSPDDAATVPSPSPMPERPRIDGTIPRLIAVAVVVALLVAGIIGGVLIYRS